MITDLPPSLTPSLEYAVARLLQELQGKGQGRSWFIGSEQMICDLRCSDRQFFSIAHHRATGQFNLSPIVFIVSPTSLSSPSFICYFY